MTELIEHLLLLLTPPEGHGGTPLFFPDVHQIPWGTLRDQSLSGLITQGTPTAKETQEINRVLLPGGHLLLIAPKESPTGWEGANTLEENGMDIRDAILVIEDASETFFYTPKVSRREREAGCENLPGISGESAVNRKKDSKGIANPRAGASRNAKQVKNFHPTVKPIKLMRGIISDIPPGKIIDPFMGSGSTGLVCVETGHDFVGIEEKPEYLQIADARIRHKSRGKKVEIHSDQPTQEQGTKPPSIFDW